MHFCFKICYNNKIKPLFSKCDTKEVNKIMKDIIKGYCPGKSTFTRAKIRDSLNKTYAKSLVGGMSPLDSTINYLSDLKNIYKNNEKIYSDIALSLYKTGQYDDIEDIYDYTADVKELYDDVIDQPDEIIDSDDEAESDETDEVEETLDGEDDLEDVEELEDDSDEVEETEDTSGLTGGAKKKCKGKKCLDKKKTTKTKKDKTKKKTTKKAKAKKVKKSKAGKKYNALHMEVGKNGVVYTTSKLNHEIKSLFDKSPLLSYETSLYYPIIEEDEEEPEIIEQPKIEEPVKKEPEDVIELSDGNIVDKAEEDEEETII